MNYVGNLPFEQVIKSQEMSHELWGDGSSLPERIERLSRQLEQPKLLTMAGLIDGSELAASMKVYSIALAQAGKVYPSIGLGAIFTHPAYRGRGLAPQLIEQVIADAARAGAEAAVLYSDIAPSYYERLQFRQLPGENFQIDVEDAQSWPVGDWALSPLPPTFDMGRFYEAAMPPALLRPWRDPAVWRFFRERNFQGEDFLIVSAGQPIGYASITRNKDDIWIEEIIGCDSDRRRALAVLVKWAAENGAASIRGWLPYGLSDAKIPVIARKKAIPMIRPIGRSLPLDDIAPGQCWLGSIDHF